MNLLSLLLILGLYSTPNDSVTDILQKFENAKTDFGLVSISLNYKGMTMKNPVTNSCNLYFDRRTQDKDSIAAFHTTRGLQYATIYNTKCLYYFFDYLGKKVTAKDIDTTKLIKVANGGLDYMMIFYPLLKKGYFNKMIQGFEDSTSKITIEITDSLYIIKHVQQLDEKFKEIYTEQYEITKDKLQLIRYYEEFLMYEGKQYSEYLISYINADYKEIDYNKIITELLNEYKPTKTN